MGEDVEMHGFALSIFFLMDNLVSHPMISVAKPFSAKGLFQVSVCELNLQPKAANELTRKMPWFLGTTKSKDESYSDASRNGVFFVCGQQAS